MYNQAHFHLHSHAYTVPPTPPQAIEDETAKIIAASRPLGDKQEVTVATVATTLVMSQRLLFTRSATAFNLSSAGASSPSRVPSSITPARIEAEAMAEAARAKAPPTVVQTSTISPLTAGHYAEPYAEPAPNMAYPEGRGDGVRLAQARRKQMAEQARIVAEEEAAEAEHLRIKQEHEAAARERERERQVFEWRKEAEAAEVAAAKARELRELEAAAAVRAKAKAREEAAANAAAKAKRDAEAAADRAFMQREEAELRMAAQAKEEAEEAQRVEAAEKSRLEAEQRMAEVRHR